MIPDEARTWDSQTGLADGTPTHATHARTNEESSSLPEISLSSVTRTRAYGCDDCENDPTAAPGRYCAPRRCLCGHETCHAFAFYQPRALRLRALRDGGRR